MRRTAMTIAVIIMVTILLWVANMWDENVWLKIENDGLKRKNAELIAEKESYGITDKKLEAIEQSVKRNREDSEETLRLLKDRLGVQ